jgi:transcription antitermination factor NusG
MPSFGNEILDAPLLRDRFWHVLYVVVKNEKKVAGQLIERRISHYLPVRKEVRRWSDRRMTIMAPLFPGYVFVRCSIEQRFAITGLPGVVRFVSTGVAPAIIPDAEFERLRELLDLRSVEAHDYLQPGKRVRLTGGVFDGFEGTYVRDRGKLRAIVAIDWLQRSVIVDVEACEVQPASSRAALPAA